MIEPDVGACPPPEAATESIADKRSGCPVSDQVRVFAESRRRDVFGTLCFGGYDATKKAREAWLSDEDSREGGVAAVHRMLEKERTAVAAIERALAAIELKRGAAAARLKKLGIATAKPKY